ncbi:MAG: FecR family protein [Motiliproteus sp.]
MNSKRTLPQGFFACLIGLLILPIIGHAENAPTIGKVLLSLGQNTVISADRQTRRLKRQSQLFSGDSIKTSKNGRVQIRFTDGSLLSLKSDTEFAIDSYKFNKANPNDGKAVYKLIKGGMRTVTGLIGREEKDDYEVKTSVATIGIRGTHYSLFLCDASCASQTKQAKGLYGGVDQGGIRISNRASSTDIGVDDFFHVGGQDQALTPLLSPPELLTEDATEAGDSGEDEGETQNKTEESETEEEQSQQQDGSEADGNSEKGDSDTTETTVTSESSSDTEVTGTVTDPTAGETLTEASSTSAEGTSAESTTTADTSTVAITSLSDFDAGTVTYTESSITTDTTTVTTATAIPASDANTTSGTTTSNVISSTSVQAPDGAVVGVALIDIDTEGLRGGGGSFLVSSQNTLLLDTVNGADNIPVFASVKDNSSSIDGDSCNPCTFDAGSATLLDTGGLGGVGKGVNWGRWNIGWTVTDNGQVSSTKDNFHFIYSPNRTSDTTARSLTGVYRFNLAGGTSPGDNNNTLGSYTGNNSIDIDFDTHTVLDVNLQVLMQDGKLYSASMLHDVVAFEHILAQNHVALEGTCTGGGCGGPTNVRGGFSIDFVGTAAERIISAWGLEEDTFGAGSSAFAVSGVAAYDQGTALSASTFTIAPPDSILSIAFANSGQNGESESIQIESGFNTSIVLDASGDFKYAQFDLPFEVTGDSCIGCELSKSTATLADSGSLNDAGKVVKWGRWDGTWVGTGSRELQSPGPLHYIYSQNKTPNATVLAKAGSGTINYNYVAGSGTAPMDETGATGTVNGTSRVTVDFNSMNVSNVQLGLTVNGRTITATENTAQSINNILNNQPIKLIGTCNGGACSSTPMVGEMHLDFVGTAADRMVSSYGMHRDSANPNLSVSGTAVFDQ